MAAHCRSCAAPIVWVMTLSGKRMPVDAAPVGDGNVVIAMGDPKANPPTFFGIQLSGLTELARAEAVKAGVPLRKSHFATCPNAEAHRRGANNTGGHA